MNIKELSIGNWVEFQNSYYKIRDLYIGGAIHLEDKNGNGLSLTSNYILNEIKPIPLTDEILDKNFEQVYDEYEDAVYHWYINKKDGLFISVYETDSYHISTMTFDCKYVHQLQNVLTILLIDKEIQL